MSAHDKTCAGILRKAVADFRNDTLSLSTLEHFITRVENVAESLELVAEPTYTPQSIRADAELLTEADFAAYNHYTCGACGHVETRQAVTEPPRRCENCHSPANYRVFDSLDAAELFSERVA